MKRGSGSGGAETSNVPGDAPARDSRNGTNDRNFPVQWAVNPPESGARSRHPHDKTIIGKELGMSVRSMLHALFLLTVVVGGSLALTACNTAKGLGEDVEAGGELMQKGAQDTEDAIED